MNILCNFVHLDSQNLTAAIDYTGDTYNEIGDMYEKQVRNLNCPVKCASLFAGNMASNVFSAKTNFFSSKSVIFINVHFFRE